MSRTSPSTVAEAEWAAAQVDAARAAAHASAAAQAAQAAAQLKAAHLKERLMPAFDRGVGAVEQARDWAAPRIEKSWERGLEAAAPAVEAAAEKVVPAVDAARDKIVEDFVPRVVEAVTAAAAAAAAAKVSAEEALTSTAESLSDRLPSNRRKARARRRRKIALFAVLAIALSAGVAAWLRSRKAEQAWNEVHPEPTDALARHAEPEPEAEADSEPKGQAAPVTAEVPIIASDGTQDSAEAPVSPDEPVSVTEVENASSPVIDLGAGQGGAAAEETAQDDAAQEESR